MKTKITPTRYPQGVRVLMGEVEHNVKVTSFGGKKWGIRIFANGVITKEAEVESKSDIAAQIHDMLRMEDKCGNISKMASRSRFRFWEKKDKENEANKI